MTTSYYYRKQLIGACLATLLCTGVVANTNGGTDSGAGAAADGDTLTVVFRASATTCQRIDDQLSGPECNLARGLAKRLGRSFKAILVPTCVEARRLVSEGGADLAVTGTPFVAGQGLLAGPAYNRTSQCLVYRYGDGNPRGITRLGRGRLVVPAGSHHQQLLEDLAVKHPSLSWQAVADAGYPELLRQVAAGEARYTLADSHELAVYRQYYPSLRCARVLTETRKLNWALKASADPEFNRAVAGFFTEQQANGEINRVFERHLGHSDNLDFVSASRFARAVRDRLPKYRAWFERAARKNGVDWRLLAAIGYQESHWDPNGVSPTGVRGLMMLTRDTARQMGVSNRRSARQSIDGGSRYFKRVKGKIPRRIPEPDRTWLALAAYNLGFGHLEDGRILTQRHGGDPDRWSDVVRRLPLLSKRKFYRTLKRGKARGSEAVRYVSNIRSYYDILRWRTGSDEARLMPGNGDRIARATR